MIRSLRLYLSFLITLLLLLSCAGDVISVSNDPIVVEKEDPDLKNPALEWSDSACEAVLGSENTFPALSNRFEVDVVYSSSSDQVATIAEDGTVTIVAAGTTTITASHAKDDSYQESTAQYILTVIRGDGGLAWSTPGYSCVIDGENVFPVLSNANNLEVTYSSSDESVAMISDTGEVIPVAAGTTVITASSAGNDIYDASSASYTLTIMRAAAGLEWSSSSATAVMDREPQLPTLSNLNKLEISYSSSNESVATISGSGAVTLVGAGTTVITATSSETGRYSAESVSYTLTVSKSEVVISWSENSCTATIYSGVNSFPVLANPGAQEISYSSSNPAVAEVDSEGNVRLVAEGTASIIATSLETAVYSGASASYTLTVLRAEAGLQWSSSTASAVMDQAPVLPTLSNPNNLEISYSSGNESVATISADGAVTLVGAGTTVITATSSQTGQYSAGSASYNLTVSKSDAAISWSESECTATIGSADNTFPVLINPGAQEIAYSSSNESVAKVDSRGNVSLLAEGTASIIATSSETAAYNGTSVHYTLTVIDPASHLVTPEIFWSAAEASATMGSTPTLPFLSHPFGLQVNYSSSDEEVATVDSFGNVTLNGAGTTVITASTEAGEVYTAGSASYILTVVKANPNLRWSASTANATMGSGGNYPTLTHASGLEIEYSSSNTGVATIGSDGTIILVGAGTTVITASSTASEIFNASSASYTLTVSLAEAQLTWSSESYTAILNASGYSFPTLSNPANLEVRYSSSESSVATVSTSGAVTLVGAGTTVITASSDATGTYTAGSASYILTVVKADSGLRWSTASATATMGSGGDYPTLINTGGLAVDYSSSNTDVATVGSDGTIILVGAGTTVITASSEGSAIYNAGSASYTLTVSLAQAPLSWSAESYTATLKSSGYTFPTLTNPSGLDVDYLSSNTSVAEIDGSGNITLVGAGSTTITARHSGSAVYAPSSASYTLKTEKNSVSIAFSQSSFTAILEESANAFPTLSIEPAGLPVSYSSSNSGVATVGAATGAVSLVSLGSAVITATFAGDDFYKAASATYTLSVRTNLDAGNVTTTFASSGDPDSDDDISNTVFTRLITVDYKASGATVTGWNAVSDVMDVTIDGNRVTINYTGTENVVYKLTGSTSNGFFKLYSGRKQALWLDGVSITNTAGAAINNQSGKRTFVYVDGTNSLSDGSSAAYTTDSGEDCKGVFFSEGQLIFSGSGALTVTANNSHGKSGIASDDYIRLMSGPAVTVSCGSSAGHGVKVNEYVQMSAGSLDITTRAAMKKGITSDNYVLIEGGDINLNISGGVAKDSDSGEYKGSAGINSDNYFGITGGTVTINNTGAGGKGISTGDYDYEPENHTLTDSYITGGVIRITTSGSKTNDVTCKGIKVGYKYSTGSSSGGGGWGGWGGWGGNTNNTYGGNLRIDGGKIYVTCLHAEGIEVKGTLTFNGGETYAYSTGDDAINSQGKMTINDGFICGYSTANDGLDTNNDMDINGGYVIGITTRGNPEVGLDAASENRFKVSINSGATVVVYGGIERGYSSQQPVRTMNIQSGGWNGLWNGSEFIAAFKSPANVTTMTVSAPSLSNTAYKGVSVNGETFCEGCWAVDGISGGTEVSIGN